jgi:hypothetical protein
VCDRKWVIIATKCGLVWDKEWFAQRKAFNRLKARSIREEAEASLRRLGPVAGTNPLLATLDGAAWPATGTRAGALWVAREVLLINITGADGQPPADILRVILRFTFLGQQVGTVSTDAGQLSPGRYMRGGSQLSLAGQWLVDVVVRRKGKEDSVARFDWTVALPLPSRPVLVSDQPLKPVLTVVAAVLFAGMLAAAGVLWTQRALRSPGPPEVYNAPTDRTRPVGVQPAKIVRAAEPGKRRRIMAGPAPNRSGRSYDL